MNPLAIALGLLAAAGAQVFLGRLIPGLGTRIDVFMILVAAVARSGARPKSLLAGAAAGAIEDALSGDLFGLNGFSKTAIGYTMAAVTNRVMVQNPVAIAISLASGVLGNALVVATLRFLLAQPEVGPGPGALALRAVVTSAAGVAVALVARHPWRERWRESRLRRLRS